MTPTILWQENSVVELKPYLWIALGAVVGASARFAVGRWAARAVSTEFPYGTLIINLTGSFILGLFLTWTTERVLADPRWRYIVAIGFCGSYTTFSSYAYETIVYFEQGHWLLFWSNVLFNNALCLLAVIGGAALARAL